MSTSGRGFGGWHALKRHFHDGNWRPLAVVILLEILFALLLFRSPGTEDVSQYWMPWIDGILKNGLVDRPERIIAPGRAFSYAAALPVSSRRY